MKKLLTLAFSLTLIPALLSAEPPEFKWREVEIDKIEIGYGLQLTDVDGDGKTDIVLAEKPFSGIRIPVGKNTSLPKILRSETMSASLPGILMVTANVKSLWAGNGTFAKHRKTALFFISPHPKTAPNCGRR